MQLLRSGVLDGLALLYAHSAARSPHGEAVAARTAELGARVTALEIDPLGSEPDAGEGGTGVLVWDGAGALGLGDSVEAVRAALDGAWLAIRPLAGSPVKLLLLAPPPGGPHAEAARAGLENLARTLSIEWARFGTRTVAILPGAEARPQEVAELAAFLASPAGDYYSGCRFELR